MLLKVRLTSFLVGFGVASGLALYQLRNDVLQSHNVLTHQVNTVQHTTQRALRQHTLKYVHL